MRNCAVTSIMTFQRIHQALISTMDISVINSATSYNLRVRATCPDFLW